MRTGWRLPIGAAVAGLFILWVWFGKQWPGKDWRLTSRASAIEQGRLFAARYGVDVQGWKAYICVKDAKDLSGSAPPRSSVAIRISYAKPGTKDAAEVQLNPNGQLKSFRAPKGDKSSKQAGTDEVAATAAFKTMAGDQAASYQSPIKSFGDEDDEEEDFEFKQNPRPDSQVRDRIKVRTKGGVLKRIERERSRGGEDESESEDDADDVGFLGAANGIIYTGAGVVVVALFIFWMTRRLINQKFPLRVAGASFAALMIILVAGAEWDKIHFVYLDHNLPVFSQVVLTLVIAVFATVGRGISAEARPKWFTLEEVCWLAPVSQPLGRRLAAGLLCGPALAAIPFLVTGSGVFRTARIAPYKAELLYSRVPLVDSVSVAALIGILLLLGFVLPASRRLMPSRWLRWPLMIVVGTVISADMTRVVSGSLIALLVTGAAGFALFVLVWAQYDLLATFAMQLSGGMILGMLMLGQKGQSFWSLAAGFGVLGLAATYCRWRGAPVAAGDPSAVVPALTGFRAEREKLLAEFSVARRAQQDMLPQAPPGLPGYSIAASCTPSLEVGGDLYDFLTLQDGRIGIGVADVSGKGVPAALYMTLTKGLLSAVTKRKSEIAGVMEEVNRHLHSVTRKKVFVTMALGFLDTEKRLLECVRAGHNPMVWRQESSGSTRLITPGGLGLGITSGKIFAAQLKVEQLQLAPGDAVVFYSDGITEAMNRDLEQFGEQRLMEAVVRADRLDATATRDSILSEVSQFLAGVHPQDDMTLVVLRVGEQA